MQPEQRKQLLAALLAGELQPASPAVEEAVRNDPELLGDFAAARDLEATCRRLGREAMADLAAARQPSPPGERTARLENRVRKGVERHAANAIARARFARRRTWLLAAAALMITGAIGIHASANVWTSGSPYVPPTLGGRSEEGLAPHGAVASIADFSWLVPSALGRTFVVHVHAVDGRGSVLFSSPELESSPWQPSPARIAELPPTFHWRLVVRDADGNDFTHSTAVTRQ